MMILTALIATTAVGQANYTLVPAGAMLGQEAFAFAAAPGTSTLFAAATADINTVRTANGLAPHPVFTSKTAAINAVLYEKRFSLLFEGAQRLVDLRAYGRLNSNFFRRELPSDPFNAAFPIPRGELNARGLTTNPVCTA